MENQGCTWLAARSARSLPIYSHSLITATNPTPRAGPSMPDSDPLEHPRVTLPKNLSETLKRLEDAELQTLLREVTAEAERRGVMKSVNTVAAPQTAPAVKFQAQQSKNSGVSADLPAGKANLIKASHSAGMKPQAIARMFRLSQSVVNRVLGMPAKSKK
jgi:hypothetical protein